VVLTWTDDRADPQYARSAAALERLAGYRDARGRPLQVHKLHQPAPVLITAEEAAGVDKVAGTLPREPGDRMAASYVNFYIANAVVVAPAFGDPQDAPAMETLARLFPNRRILSVPAREILLGGGNIHCITQQEPLGDAMDVAPAMETLARLFPNRRILSVPAREILLGGGNIHCITQQEPLGARERAASRPR
jgi:agmatine deiminase